MKSARSSDAEAASDGAVRRIVTGHDHAGASTIIIDAADAATHRFGGEDGPLFHEIWRTGAQGADDDGSAGLRAGQPLVLTPASGGTLLRIVDIPPERPGTLVGQSAALPDAFAQAGAAGALTAGEAGARHHTMHRTATIDYGIVLAGEITLILDDGETVARMGDVIVQRATNHGWANRSGRPCRIAFILVDTAAPPPRQVG